MPSTDAFGNTPEGRLIKEIMKMAKTMVYWMKQLTPEC